MIRDLPLTNVEESIKILNDRIVDKRNLLQVCFIITSCIYVYDKPLNCSSTRSVYTSENRIMQTKETINSIRKYCPGAYIILTDNGEQNPADSLSHCVDNFIYLGNDKTVRRAAASKNKSVGETVLLLKTLSDDMKKFDLIFKISGRYCLTHDFDVTRFDTDAFNFLNYHSGKIITSIGKFRPGSHSTRLYAIPGKMLDKYKNGLGKTYFKCLRGKSIEFALPEALKHEKFFYHRKLGLSGVIAVDGNEIDE